MDFSKMPRLRKYLKFLAHFLYLLIMSYFVTHRKFKIVNVEKINRYAPDLKHILIWTDLPGIKHHGQEQFIKNKCGAYNCFLTKNRTLFGDVRYFDAIVFNLQEVSSSSKDFPKIRGEMQKYIFAANDSADNYPVCDSAYDGFFNWTWTYRRDSTIPYNFFSIHNLHNQNLGYYFKWKNNMDPLTVLQKNHISSKHKAAATFLDQCKSRSKREELLYDLKEELAKYNLTIDIYGECGTMKCKRKTLAPCYYRLRKNYFFYLALEDSISDDFVTDVVLHAYNNDVVPIVYGGAKYKNFLPPNSYIEIKSFLNASALAMKMHSIMRSKPAYYEFFRWKNHYHIEKGSVLDPCSLCDVLNTPSMMLSSFNYTNFREWWNPQHEFRC